ncbi:MAG: diphosphomevalonate decarboxylase [archaeon]|nr:diphosphomevalonate decarboxylase [archaeon]HIK01279.1 diphosphomevalonate decarboxylase [Candidatus Undinarchaeales archaeon ERR594346 U_76725]|tara:strand:- start:8907 stop:9851 length:945 start_codon:yes stop_codon:yes gene_type:complete
MARASAHPMQGLVKYHGLKDSVKRIPYHGSISVCTAPLESTTSVEFHDGEHDQIEIDGNLISGRAFERVKTVLDEVRKIAGSDKTAIVHSKNSFPQGVGLGSSSSGFATLALAAFEASGANYDMKLVSETARLGSGSACRAVTGGISEWITDKSGSYSVQIGSPEDFKDWSIVVPLVESITLTEKAHEEVETSPLFKARLDYIEKTLSQMRNAVKNKEVEKIWELAEQDTRNLHAVTMTGREGLLAWNAATAEIMHRTTELREEFPIYYSIDTGATPYLNTYKEHEKRVISEFKETHGVKEILVCSVGESAKIL